ncbi:MAG: N-acetyltransferase family protein [Sphingobacteriia bacterium]|nr:N-acetyltransferase family protein [Sphingobacteriia bacterium]
MHPIIRFATIDDLPIIVDIYNQAVRSGNVTADIDPVTTDQRRKWFSEHEQNTFPVYIIEAEERVTGWGSISPYRKGRNGLKTTAEISYYIDYQYHNRGFGKLLIGHMLTDCRRIGIRNLFAILLDINYKSAGILRNFGFVEWGHLPDIVNLNDCICGQLIYGKNLGIA